MKWLGMLASANAALDMLFDALKGEPLWFIGAAIWIWIAVAFARSNGKTEAV